LQYRRATGEHEIQEGSSIGGWNSTLKNSK